MHPCPITCHSSRNAAMVPPLPPAARLAKGEAHAWIVDLRLTDNSVEDIDLPDNFADAARAGKMRANVDRRRFLRGRQVLRRVLSRYLGTAPAAIRFAAEDNGRPILAAPTAFDFNSSRSGNYAVIGLTANSRIGVDIEAIQPDFPAADVAVSFFSPTENTSLAATSSDRRTGAFFHCWVSKEACVKAWGHGLSLPLASFDVAVDPDLAPAMLGHRMAGLRPLWLYRLTAPAGYAAVLAADQPITSLKIITATYPLALPPAEMAKTQEF